MGLEQGRLWALKSSDTSDVCLYAVETRLPTLYSRKKDAEQFQKKLKETDCDVVIVEVEIHEIGK